MTIMIVLSNTGAMGDLDIGMETSPDMSKMTTHVLIIIT